MKGRSSRRLRSKGDASRAHLGSRQMYAYHGFSSGQDVHLPHIPLVLLSDVSSQPSHTSQSPPGSRMGRLFCRSTSASGTWCCRSGSLVPSTTPGRDSGFVEDYAAAGNDVVLRALAAIQLRIRTFREFRMLLLMPLLACAASERRPQ